MKRHVVIIGAGAIGQAIRHLLRNQDINLNLWDIDKTKVKDQKELGALIPGAAIVFLCVPSWVLREALLEIKPFLGRSSVIASVSKGLEIKTNHRIDQLASEILPNNKFVLLSGPMIARLITEDKHSYATIASLANNKEAIRSVEQLFLNTKLSLSVCNDIASVAISGVLKNVYAIILGIIDALDCGNNTKGWIVSLSLREMQAIAQRLKLDPVVMLGTSGLADLITTGFSPTSTNQRLGKELVFNGQTEIKSEGLISLPGLMELLEDSTQSLPLLNALHRAIENKTKTAIIFSDWLKEEHK